MKRNAYLLTMGLVGGAWLAGCSNSRPAHTSREFVVCSDSRPCAPALPPAGTTVPGNLDGLKKMPAAPDELPRKAPAALTPKVIEGPAPVKDVRPPTTPGKTVSAPAKTVSTPSPTSAVPARTVSTPGVKGLSAPPARVDKPDKNGAPPGPPVPTLDPGRSLPPPVPPLVPPPLEGAVAPNRDPLLQQTKTNLEPPLPVPASAKTPGQLLGEARKLESSLGAPAISAPPVLTPSEPARDEPGSTRSVTLMPQAMNAEYTALTGYVQQWRRTWRLRYAGVDADDPFGGSVVLAGGAELDRLRDGQRVRVQGLLVPPSERQSPPTYQVQTLEVISEP